MPTDGAEVPLDADDVSAVHEAPVRTQLSRRQIGRVVGRSIASWSARVQSPAAVMQRLTRFLPAAAPYAEKGCHCVLESHGISTYT